MSIQGEIRTLYSDREQTQAVFPRTKVSAVSDENGVGLNVLLDNKAPAGYGLGVSAPQITLTDCNDGSYTGWYITTMSTTNSPLETGGWLRADMFNESYGTQTWYNDRYNGIVAQRFKISGVWQPWEWENPPMIPGVEYRTTERHEGKPVYVKAIDFGNLPNATIKEISHGVTNISLVLSCGGVNNRSRTPMPSSDGTVSGGYFMGAGAESIWVVTTRDVSDALATVWLKYTKSTQ